MTDAGGEWCALDSITNRGAQATALNHISFHAVSSVQWNSDQTSACHLMLFITGRESQRSEGTAGELAAVRCMRLLGARSAEGNHSRLFRPRLTLRHGFASSRQAIRHPD